ncbi:MAG: caspase family protein [Geminicoccaceae bacterium]
MNEAVKDASQLGQRQAVQLASGETISALLFDADLDIAAVAEGDGFVTSAWPIAANRLIFRLSNGAYRELNLDLGSFVDVSERMAQIRSGNAFAFGSVDQTMAWAEENGSIKVSPGFWHRNSQHIGDSTKRVTTLALSAGGRAMVHGNIAGKATIWDISNRRQSSLGPGFDAAVSAAAIADDLNVIAISDGTELQLVSTQKLGEAAVKAEPGFRVRDLDLLAEDGRGLVIAIGTDRARFYLADTGAATLSSLDLASCPTPEHLWRHGNLAAVTCAGSKLAFFRLSSTGAVPLGPPMPSPEGLMLAYLAADGDVMMTMSGNGRFGMVDRRNGKTILHGILAREGWIAVDRQGRFDGQGIEPSALVWTLRQEGEDLKNVSFDQLSNAFRYPGLMSAVFEGAGRNLRSVVFDPESQGLPLPPEIAELRFLEHHDRLDKPLQVIATAADVSGHTINDIHLYHNGRLVRPSLRFLDKSETGKANADGDVTIRSVAYQVEPVPGRNEFRAVSEGIGGIESAREGDEKATLIADVTGERGAGKLHYLGIGVGQFAAPELRLDFPSQSVSDVADLLFERKTGSLDAGERLLVLDREADRGSIEAAFKAVGKASRSEDTVVVYLSGHGVYQDDRWYFPLANAWSLDRLDGRDAIDHHQLQDLIGEIDAHNILILIDACHAGAATGALDVVEMRRLTGQVSERAGASLIAASRATQEAIEAKTLGHGLFSAAIIEGLSGKADIGDDGAVSAFELARYASDKIPAYSLEFQQDPQIPESRLGGFDFALTRSR